MSEEQAPKEPTILDKAAELAGEAVEMTIEDGTFCIRPADAAIMMLASIAGMEKEIEDAWSAVDELTETIEKTREENATFREVLTDVAALMEYSGMENEAAAIYNVIYRVVGIDEDGNETEFIFDPNKEQQQ
jgi:hypothetical protein